MPNRPKNGLRRTQTEDASRGRRRKTRTTSLVGDHFDPKRLSNTNVHDYCLPLGISAYVPDGGLQLTLDEEESVDALFAHERPPNTVHAFILPCRVSGKHRPRSSKGCTCLYGACHTSYVLKRIPLPNSSAALQRPKALGSRQVSYGDTPDALKIDRKTYDGVSTPDALKIERKRPKKDLRARVLAKSATVPASPADRQPYVEFDVTLTKLPGVGLGLHLAVNSNGCVIVTHFVDPSSEVTAALAGSSSSSSAASSPAKRSDKIRVGDELTRVNGVEVYTRVFQEVVAQIRAADDEVTLSFCRGSDPSVRMRRNRSPNGVVFVPKIHCVVSTSPCFDMLKKTATRIARGAHRSSAEPNLQDVRDACEIVARNAREDQKGVLTSFREAKLSKYNTVPMRPDVSFKKALFDVLSINAVVDVAAYLLLEKRVVLVSDHCGRLVTVCEALLALLHPFVWTHAYQPVLPWSLLDEFVDSSAQSAESRASRIARTRSSSDDPSSTIGSGNRPLLVGLCTADLVSSNGGGGRGGDPSSDDNKASSWVGSSINVNGGRRDRDDKRDAWELQENDSDPPYRRVQIEKKRNLSLYALLKGAVVVDLDVLSMVSSSAAAVAHPEANRNTSSFSKRSTTLKIETTHALPRTSFPPSIASELRTAFQRAALRDGRSLERAARFSSCALDESRLFSTLMASTATAYQRLVSNYGHVYVTLDDEPESSTVVLAFNLKVFLSVTPVEYHPFLDEFLRTDMFKEFLKLKFALNSV